MMCAWACVCYGVHNITYGMEVRGQTRAFVFALYLVCDSLLLTSAMHQVIWPKGFWEASCLYVLAIGALILQRIQLTQALGIQALVCIFARQVFPPSQSIALRSPQTVGVIKK